MNNEKTKTVTMEKVFVVDIVKEREQFNCRFIIERVKILLDVGDGPEKIV